jgi:ribosomal protein S18 acetylase RimI-like enzyme
MRLVLQHVVGGIEMPVELRPAVEGDLPQILAVYREAGLESRGSLDLEQARRLFRKMASYPSYRVYVAEAEGRIVGSFELLVMDNLANGGLPSALVEDVAVSRAYQGRGIGSSMMRFALEECRRQGCYKMALSSNESRSAAHAFYEALGFVRHGYSFKVEFDRAQGGAGEG